jgi:hypothetical protein
MPPHPFDAGRVTSTGTEPGSVLYTVRAMDKLKSVPEGDGTGTRDILLGKWSGLSGVL